MYNSINSLGWLVLIVGAVIVYKWVRKKVFGVILLTLAVLAAGAVSLKAKTPLWFETSADGEAPIDAKDGDLYCCIGSRSTGENFSASSWFFSYWKGSFSWRKPAFSMLSSGGSKSGRRQKAARLFR